MFPLDYAWAGELAGAGAAAMWQNADCSAAGVANFMQQAHLKACEGVTPYRADDPLAAPGSSGSKMSPPSLIPTAVYPFPGVHVPTTTSLTPPTSTSSLAGSSPDLPGLGAAWGGGGAVPPVSPAVAAMLAGLTHAGGSSAAAPVDRSRSTVFFAGVPPTVTEHCLLMLFSAMGTVVDINLFKPFRSSSTSKGCGLVVFSQASEAANAIATLHGVFKFPNARSAMAVEWMDPLKQHRKARAHLMQALQTRQQLPPAYTLCAVVPTTSVGGAPGAPILLPLAQ